MNQLYLPNFVVNSGTSGALGKTSLTISRNPAIPEIDLVVVVVPEHAPELSHSSSVARTTPDKPIKATVVGSNCSLV
jgi:hypothetical protein